MKGDIGAILHETQEQYIETLLLPRDHIAASIEEDARSHKVSIVDPEVGRFLYITARAMHAKRILEVGTATGYSSLWLARALSPSGRLVTIDTDVEIQHKAHQYWIADGIDDRIKTRVGPALEVLSTLRGKFDMFFIDTGMITEYPSYLDLALPLLRIGALILVDNALWNGRVARGDQDLNPKAMREFNQYALSHPRLTTSIIPLGDGVLYAIKER